MEITRCKITHIRSDILNISALLDAISYNNGEDYDIRIEDF